MTSPPTIRFRCVTLRRSGANDIRIVQAESADAARERLIAAGLEPVSIDPLGPSLFETLLRRQISLPAWRPRLTVPKIAISCRTLIGAALILATIPFTLAVGSWGLAFTIDWQADRLARQAAPEIAAYRAYRRTEQVRAFAAQVMAAPGISAVLARLATILPADSGLASAARDEAGRLTIEIDTPDPDRIRPLLATDPLFGGLREIGQSSTDDGAIRVTLKEVAR